MTKIVDYYHAKLNARASSRVVKNPKTSEINGENKEFIRKSKALENCKTLANKPSIKSSTFYDFVKYYQIFFLGFVFSVDF